MKETRNGSRGPWKGTMKPLETNWPTMPKYDIRCDIYGRGEPEVVLFQLGTMTEAERIALSEAERRGIISKEQADHARGREPADLGCRQESARGGRAWRSKSA